MRDLLCVAASLGLNTSTLCFLMELEEKQNNLFNSHACVSGSTRDPR